MNSIWDNLQSRLRSERILLVGLIWVFALVMLKLFMQQSPEKDWEYSSGQVQLAEGTLEAPERFDIASQTEFVPLNEFAQSDRERQAENDGFEPINKWRPSRSAEFDDSRVVNASDPQSSKLQVSSYDRESLKFGSPKDWKPNPYSQEQIVPVDRSIAIAEPERDQATIAAPMQSAEDSVPPPPQFNSPAAPNFVETTPEPVVTVNPAKGETATTENAPELTEQVSETIQQAPASSHALDLDEADSQFSVQPEAPKVPSPPAIGKSDESIALNAALSQSKLATVPTDQSNAAETPVEVEGSLTLEAPEETPSTELATENVPAPDQAETWQPETVETSPPVSRVASRSAEPFTMEPPTWTAPPTQEKLPAVLANSGNYVLAGQPKAGAHYKDDTPITDRRANVVEDFADDFSPTPTGDGLPYDPYQQMQIYEGKSLFSNQRPLVELGRPWYQLGQLSPGYNWFGKHNNITPQFLVYGDFRTAIASNTQNGDNQSLIASEVNLDFDLKLTSTERFHMFMSPVDDGVNNSRYLLDEDEFIGEYDADIDFGYFEGDLGAMVGGLTNQTLPFDLPFAVGIMPLVIQNGVYINDAFLGAAATIPARNSARFGISNMDVTFLAGFDKINSDAFPGDDSAAKMYGVLSFIEALNGYFEIDYMFLDDRNEVVDRSYHNIGLAYTRRFGRFLSHSTRIIINAGQDSSQGPNTADGVLFLSENSLITSAPSTLVPYMNFFAGSDRPQSVARAAQFGGILANTGILFESDSMTGYPTLDATANDTFGGALGLNMIAEDFSQQLILEIAALGVHGNDATRNAQGAQFGMGFRYQLPLSNSMIFRTDGMLGWLENEEDVRGLRMELRRKY